MRNVLWPWIVGYFPFSVRRGELTSGTATPHRNEDKNVTGKSDSKQEQRRKARSEKPNEETKRNETKALRNGTRRKAIVEM